ncbi:MAG: hypothetical protein LBF89_05570 [Bacteroidales bacterium]|jgi:hypothetical protein|nr:hypothetical protein [Bacteroidales bacterium]
MKPLIFIYPHDDVFQDVKQESSLLAERINDKEGNSLFESIVFDEEYLTLFRKLFSDARSYVTPALSAYIKEIPAETEFYEARDFTKARNYELILAMPDDFNFHLAKPADAKIRQFLIAYILYRWLETKLPEQAASYLARADKILSEVKNLLDNRINPIRRYHGYW